MSVFILGVIFWFFYSFTLYRFFAEYERIVIFTSIIVVIISGFGLQWLEDYVKMKFEASGSKIFKMAMAVALLAFLFLVPFYTQQDDWGKIISISSANGETNYPRSPANNYLISDDLSIFKNIKEKR